MRVTLPIDLLLKERGVGSKNIIKEMIRQGQVFIKNDTQDWTRVQTWRTRLLRETDIQVNGVVHRGCPLLVAFHKPAGMLSALKDSRGRTVLPTLANMHPVGRLDMDTTGLLLYSSHGGLTNYLLGSNISREYIALVSGIPEESTLEDQLSSGVTISSGVVTAKLLSLENHNFESALVRLEVSEGKHRMVRRMLNNAGFPVLTLERLRYGPVELGELKPGEFRTVTAKEIGKLAYKG